MLMIRMLSLLAFGSIMAWGAAESYTRNKFGAASPQHEAVLQMFSTAPMRNPFVRDETGVDSVSPIILR